MDGARVKWSARRQRYLIKPSSHVSHHPLTTVVRDLTRVAAALITEHVRETNDSRLISVTLSPYVWTKSQSGE